MVLHHCVHGEQQMCVCVCVCYGAASLCACGAAGVCMSVYICLCVCVCVCVCVLSRITFVSFSYFPALRSKRWLVASFPGWSSLRSGQSTTLISFVSFMYSCAEKQTLAHRFSPMIKRFNDQSTTCITWGHMDSYDGFMHRSTKVGIDKQCWLIATLHNQST